MKQYSKRMAIAHWLTLPLLFVAWYLGDGIYEARITGNATLAAYYAHVLVGVVVLLLTILRWTFRGVDRKPPPAGQSLMDFVAIVIHHVMYILLCLLPITGMLAVMTSSVGLALLAGDASQLPAKYTGPGIAPHAVHETLMYVLIAVMAVHILGVVKHQFIMKDGLMERMSLRRKN